MPLGWSRDEYFSCFTIPCQTGLKQLLLGKFKVVTKMSIHHYLFQTQQKILITRVGFSAVGLSKILEGTRFTLCLTKVWILNRHESLWVQFNNSRHQKIVAKVSEIYYYYSLFIIKLYKFGQFWASFRPLCNLFPHWFKLSPNLT